MPLAMAAAPAFAELPGHRVVLCLSDYFRDLLLKDQLLQPDAGVQAWLIVHPHGAVELRLAPRRTLPILPITLPAQLHAALAVLELIY